MHSNKPLNICHCRWSPTLGELEDTAQRIWGTHDYDPVVDFASPTVFFGLYGLPDFYTLWRHKGRKWILWAGTDIIHFLNGYFLDNEGKIKIHPTQLAPWIDSYCESFVENETEQNALRSVGIRSKVVPSFLGDIDAYEVSFTPSDRPKVYASVSGDNFEQYGWDYIEQVAPTHPDIEFHLYGNKAPWISKHKNVIVHGRVSKEQMNEEIKHMQGALRPLYFDGFSEVLAKSVLWGQWPISRIAYPHMLGLEDLDDLREKDAPNLEGQAYYRTHLNKYPWAHV